MDSQKMSSLLRYIEEFETTTTSYTLEEFSVWLNGRLNPPSPLAMSMTDESVSRNIDYLLSRACRFTRMYVRVAFRDLPISTVDEYWFLDIMYFTESPSKSDVYEQTLAELTTGTQIMKRLVRVGLVQEQVDAVDKRIKRVRLTPLGRKVRDKAHALLTNIARMRALPLGETEQTEFARLLSVLDTFHSAEHKSIMSTGVEPAMKRLESSTVASA